MYTFNMKSKLVLFDVFGKILKKTHPTLGHILSPSLTFTVPDFLYWYLNNELPSINILEILNISYRYHNLKKTLFVYFSVIFTYNRIT